jgi:hypothetical protein
VKKTVTGISRKIEREPSRRCGEATVDVSMRHWIGALLICVHKWRTKESVNRIVGGDHVIHFPGSLFRWKQP